MTPQNQQPPRGTATVQCPKCGGEIPSFQARFSDRQTDSIPVSCTVRCDHCDCSIGLSFFGEVSIVYDPGWDEDTKPDHKTLPPKDPEAKS